MDQPAPGDDLEDLFARIVDEYTERLNRGHRPTVGEYAALYPQLADQLRDVLGMLPAIRPVGTISPAPDAPPPSHLFLSPARPPTAPGFAVERELGRGGMGVVYLARQETLNRPVALKMVLAGDHSTAEERVRFLAEAELIARLQHPHIVQVYEFRADADGRPYFALEYLPGGSLADRLRDGPLPPADAARLLEVLAAAIDYAHGRGVIHRDLKPSNILFDAAGEPKVTDFGLAKHSDSSLGLTATGAILGTPSYMAPEQTDVVAGAIGPAADVYALGAILYECLTARPPFRGATVLDTLDQVRRHDPLPVRDLQPAVPRDLETICLKCLEKDPARRYASAAALAADLSNFLGGKSITARPVGSAERAWRWCRRNRLVAGLLAGVLGLMAVITVGSVTAAVLFRDSQVRAETAESGERDRRIEADDNLKRALAAEADGEGKLWRSYRDAAAAARYSGRQGQRFRSLELLAAGAAIARRRGEPEHEIQRFRDEAAACLCLPDVRVGPGWPADPAGTGLVVVDRDQTVYARATTDGAVKVWRVGDGAEVAVLRVPGGTLSPLAFALDSTRLLTRDLPGSEKGSRVRCWDVAAGREAWKAVVETHAISFHMMKLRDPRVAVSDDGRLVAVTTPAGTTVGVVEAATGRTVRTVRYTARVTAVAFHPNNTHFAAWELSRGKEVHLANLGSKTVRAHPQVREVSDLGWTRNGFQFAFTQIQGARVFVHTGSNTPVREAGAKDAPAEPDADPVDPAEVAGLPGPGNMQLSYAHDEAFLLTKTTNGIGRLWRTEPHAVGMTVPSPVSGLRPDARQYLALEGTTFRLVEVEPAAERRRLGGIAGGTGTNAHGSFSPDGRVMSLIRASRTEFYDPVRGRWAGISPFVHGGHFIPGRPAFVGPIGETAAVFPTVFDGPTLRLGPPEWFTPPVPAGAPKLVGSHPPATDAAGRTLAVVEYDVIALYDLRTGLPGHRLRHPNLNLVTVSPDGRWVVGVGRSTPGVFVWDARTGERVRDLHPAALIARTRFTADGRRLVVSTQAEITVWEVGTWRRLTTTPRAEGISDSGYVGFSPDGSLTAVHAAPEEIHLLDRDGRLLVRLDARDETQPRALAFTPDGGRLLAVHVNTFWIYDLRKIRAGLRAINLDWDGPELPPDPDAPPVTRVDVVGADLLKDHAGLTARQRVADEWTLAFNPFDGPANSRLAAELAARFEYPEALARARVARLADPFDVSARRVQALAAYSLERWDEVLDATAGIDTAHTARRAETLWRRAEALLQLGRYPEALAAADEFVNQSESNRFLALQLRAAVYAGLGRHGEARADRAESLARVPDAGWAAVIAHHELLYRPARVRDDGFALALADKAVTLDPAHVQSRVVRAVALARTGDPWAALAEVDRLRPVGGGPPDGYHLARLDYIRAVCWHRAGDANAARAAFDRAAAAAAGAATQPGWWWTLPAFRRDAEAVLAAPPGVPTAPAPRAVAR